MHVVQKSYFYKRKAFLFFVYQFLLPLSPFLFHFLSVSIDEALEEEFMSILQQCNIYPETIDVPEMPYISPNDSRFDEESMHSSIVDSSHIRESSGIPEVLEFAVKSSCDFVPSKPRGWKSKRRTKAQPSSGDDSQSPLLNPNAIHDRQSLNMENVEEKWIKDLSDNDEQENKMHKMNRGMPKTIPFKIYTRPWLLRRWIIIRVE